jgi:hypothetical protein
MIDYFIKADKVSLGLKSQGLGRQTKDRSLLGFAQPRTISQPFEKWL